MSDPSRKPLHSRLFDKVTPSALKTKREKAKETSTGKADNVARYVLGMSCPAASNRACSDSQPDSTKGIVQETVDKADRSKDAAIHNSHVPA